MLRRFLVIVLLAAAPGASACAHEWASSIHAFTAGVGDLGSVDLVSYFPCRGAGRALDLTDALGVADSSYVTVGDGGILTLTFAHPIVDEAGPDLRVHVSCNISCEPGEVSVSQDGFNFTTVGALNVAPFTSFDLQAAGMAFAQFVRIRDLAEGYCPGIGLASDVDAVEALHSSVPVPTAARSWGALKTIYR